MKFIIRCMAAFLISSFIISSGCKKSGGGGGGGTNEANLVVTTNPPAGSVQAASFGPFDLTVTITSAMPSGGVKIEVTAKRDDGSNIQFFSQTISNTSAATSNFSITNTPQLIQCLVEIKVTSNSKPGNVWTGSYRYSRK
ncbi:MAG: hypothetical protein ACT4OJ_10700 [Bacteroidota bacterium]